MSAELVSRQAIGQVSGLKGLGCHLSRGLALDVYADVIQPQVEMTGKMPLQEGGEWEVHSYFAYAGSKGASLKQSRTWVQHRAQDLLPT